MERFDKERVIFFIWIFQIDIFNIAGHGNPTDEEEEDLTPPLLEEAVNLLLVNKTVMSCILVLQNRRDTEKNQDSTASDLPTVIHVPLKVCSSLVTKIFLYQVPGIVTLMFEMDSNLSFPTYL